MLKIDKVNNSLVVEGLDNKLFPDNGKLSVPLNSILLVLDESNIVTFRSASNNNVFFSANINNIRISGESVTKENIVSKFDAVSNAASGGGGGDVDVDTEILPNSTNPVENRAIYNKFASLSDNGPELADNPSLYKSEDGVLGTRFKKYDIVNGRYIGSNGTFKEVLKYNPDHFSYYNDGLNFTYSIKHLPEPEYVIDNITQEMMPIELEGNPLTEQSSIRINFFDGGMPFGMGSFGLSSGSAMLRFDANKDMHSCSVQVTYEDMEDPESYIVKYFESEEGSLVIDIPLNEFHGLYMDSPIEFMPEWIEQETLDSIVIYTSQGEVIPFSEWMENTDEAIQAIDVKDEVVSRALNTLNTTKQDNLVSGTNIKTINNESILGSGNISISGGGVQSDWDESDTTDPSYIQNKPDLSVFANSADLATVATSGDYDDLSNKPFITTVEYDAQNTALVINTVEPIP